MHLKSCGKLVRSELRLDLSQQQGALLRRGQNTRLPLAALSTNTLRCSTHLQNHGGAARAKGSENYSEDEASGLDVWSVIKPGHVREKIALFAHDDRNAKGTWEVTVKRRRRTTGQIQAPPPVVLHPPSVPLQTHVAPPPVAPPQSPVAPPQSPAPPQHSPEDEAKLSVVEMVAFLEQHVTCQSHVKLRSSASITLTRAPPLSPTVPAPTCPDRPITAEGEEPESVSVSDMVAKLESQCLRRKSQNNERRTVGRVLLAASEQTPASLTSSQPIRASEKLKATSPSSSETRKTFNFCKSDLKVMTKAPPSLPTEKCREVSKTLATSERSDAIGREKPEPLPLSHTTESGSNTSRLSSVQTQLDASTTEPNSKTVSSDVAPAKIYQIEKVFCEKAATQTALTSENATESSGASPTKPEKSQTPDEPVPGLLFLTPPPHPSVQSEKRKSPNSNSDSFVVLSLDLTVQPKPKIRRSFSLSPTSSKDSKIRNSERLPASGETSPASNSDSGPIRTLKSKILKRSETFSGSSGEKRKSCPATSSDSLLLDLNLSVQSQKSLDFVVQSEKSYLTVNNANYVQSQNSKKTDSLPLETSNQSEKRKPCPVTDFSVQSETSNSAARCERLLAKSQSEKRSLDRNAQSEKRKSCPLPGSEFFSIQSEKRKALPVSNSLEHTNQSEKRRSCPVTGSDWSNSKVSGQLVKRKACIVTNLDLVESALDDQSETRNSTDSQFCPATDPDWSNSELNSQSEKRKASSPVSKSELSNSALNPTVKRKSCPATRLDQSEKRKSCPFPSSHLLDLFTDFSSQSEESKPRPVTDIVQSESSVPVSSSVCAAVGSSVVSSSVVSSSVVSASAVSSSVVSTSVVSSSVVSGVLLRSSSDVGSLPDRRRRRKAVRAFSLCSDLAPPRYRGASEDFLLMRQRVQSLLEPRGAPVSYLSLLPHHLLVHILLLLPTRALAALKCTCHYFHLIIDTYDVRPADALWVCDPRYRDDPCKQCKRRCRRGDVSLCRWHHKPFCQAMPYGPGYWMCCHGDRRDAPGCNVGLHDNRWVPAFHSINAPIYRHSRGRDDS